MAALYPYKHLNHIDAQDIEVPLQRYTHKFGAHRKEVARLKAHEKDFLFQSLKMLKDDNNQPVFDLFEIPEAKEYLFNWIILVHVNQVMVFDGPVTDAYGLLTPAAKRKNKRFFYEYLNVWKNQIAKGEGAYFSVIKPMITQKFKDWETWAGNEPSRKRLLRDKFVYIYACFFHIYYRVKLYFDEKPKPHIIKKIGGFDVVFDVYSFIHILSRHFYPNMNQDIGVSLNDEMDCLDIEYLPDEILKFVEESNTNRPLSNSTEYLLYSYGGKHYILWLKYKRLDETRQDGFEVRSFYKCEEQRDLDKVNAPGALIVEIQ